MRKRCSAPGWLSRAGSLAVVSLLACGIASAQTAPSEETSAVEIYQLPGTGELVATGAKRPSSEQRAWGEKNLLKTRKVRFNKLGMERVNQQRQENGRRPLPPTETVPIGAEPASSVFVGPTTAAAAGSLPAAVDNSTLAAFPPIRSQGSLGSCAQFSAVYYTLTHMTALARGWNAKTGGDTYRFSPKWTYNAVNGGTDSGSWHYDAYSIAIRHGLATWAEFPYDSNYKAWCLNPAVWRGALSRRALQSGRVADVDGAGLDQVKQLLVNGYVLNFATYINSWQWKPLQNDLSTAADDLFAGKQCVVMVNGTAGGHAMTVVGYNDELWVDLNADGLVSANEKGALRIANSWGTGWGEAGFCWIAYDALRTRNPARTSEGLFWMDEATWVTARSSYTPQLIAEFTLNHLKRDQLLITLGTGSTGSATPSATWSPSKLLAYAGGPFAFDGNTTAVDGTFCLDFTDLVSGTTGARRFFVGMRDSAAGDPAWMSAMKLVDVLHGTEVPCALVPQSADGALVYAAVDYDFGTGMLPPVAVAEVSLTAVNLGDTVVFDGTGSSSPNGAITGFSWDFGDGSMPGSGANTTHAYNKAGRFNGSLTVTDATSASSSAGFTVDVTDPNVVNAPSGLSGKVSGATVTLTWADNSSNESKFVVERAQKVGKTQSVFQERAITVANVKTWSETPGSGTFYYRVRAANALASSGYSGTVTVRVR